MAKKSVPNLVQGVSQQAVQQRRETQCDEQFDCINSVLTGCTARPATELFSTRAGVDLTGAYFYEVIRAEENYLVAIKDGEITAYNLVNGGDCTVEYLPDDSVKAYLEADDAKTSFRAQALEDYVMLANKGITVEMKDDLSSERDPEALIFVKAGDQSSDFNLKVVRGSDTYNCHLRTTVDTDGNNAPSYRTNVIAMFLKALLLGDASGGGDLSDYVYSQLTTDFPTDGSWTVERDGSCIRLQSTDGADFTITSEASSSDENFRVFKDTARQLSDLPRIGFDGMILKIRGAERSADDDYYVQFNGTGDSGFWDERVGPGLKYQLEPSTMPHALFNDAPDHFQFKAQEWSTRIAGDDDSAKVPSFVGKTIQDLSYSYSRFTVIVETGAVWSKSRKPFTFFVDTVQTALPTAPVDINVPAAPASRGPSFVEKAVIVKEGVYLWSQRSQFRISVSDTGGFSEKTIEDKPDTNFEFASGVDPLAIGSSLFFAAEVGPYATISNLPFSDQGRSQEPINVTRHVGRYIPAGLDLVTGQVALGVQFWHTEGDASALFVYNWLIAEGQFAQSAWNKWRIPGGPILWAGVNDSILTILQQRAEGLAFLRCDISDRAVDILPNTGEEMDYQIRLDIRCWHAQCSGFSFDVTTGRSSLTLPYTPLPDDPPLFVVVAKDGTRYSRGQVRQIVHQDGADLEIAGDLTDHKFVIGHRITAERTENEFVLKDQQGAATIPDELPIVNEFRLTYADTGYTRIEVTTKSGGFRVKEWDGRKSGLSDGTSGPPQIGAGSLRITANDRSENTKVRLINDTFLPSSWQSAQWVYTAVDQGQSTAARLR